MVRTNRIKKVFGIIARITQAQQALGSSPSTEGAVWNALKASPSVKFLKLAEQVVMMVAGLEIVPLVEKGH